MKPISDRDALDSARHRRSRRRALLGAGLSLVMACQTTTPDEVFTARPAPTATAGAGAAPPPTDAGGGGSPPTEPMAGQSASGEAGAPTRPPDGEPVTPTEPDLCGARPVAGEPFSRAELRAAAADCAVWHYCRFELAAEALGDELAALTEAPTPEARSRTERAWNVAMERWSAAELFQFGPAGSRAEAAGRDPVHGAGLRDFIYAWPLVGRCRVEEQVATRSYEQAWSLVPISGRGLFGLEYLLFYPGSDHACSPNSATGKTWATLDAAALTQAKLDYASALVDDVVARVASLREVWSPDGGGFRSTLIEASGYESEQQAMNVIAWSLLYVEREVKDWKLGIPAELTLTHPVTQAEAAFARRGTAQIRANLAGFRALFQGCGEAGEGLGFDDWLNEVGQGELASAMLTALDDAQAAANEFPELLTASPAEIRQLYEQLRVLTTLLKAEFFGPGSTLNLKLPAGVASDTD